MICTFPNAAGGVSERSQLRRENLRMQFTLVAEACSRVCSYQHPAQHASTLNHILVVLHNVIPGKRKRQSNVVRWCCAIVADGQLDYRTVARPASSLKDDVMVEDSGSRALTVQERFLFRLFHRDLGVTAGRPITRCLAFCHKPARNTGAP
jgi:hypothetical protein